MVDWHDVSPEFSNRFQQLSLLLAILFEALEFFFYFGAQIRLVISLIEMWNQSKRCSACGFRYIWRSRTGSPPSDKNVTAWFICIPWDLSISNKRRLGL